VPASPCTDTELACFELLLGGKRTAIVVPGAVLELLSNSKTIASSLSPMTSLFFRSKRSASKFQVFQAIPGGRRAAA
jgi:hypothetical protein